MFCLVADQKQKTFRALPPAFPRPGGFEGLALCLNCVQDRVGLDQDIRCHIRNWPQLFRPRVAHGLRCAFFFPCVFSIFSCFSPSSCYICHYSVRLVNQLLSLRCDAATNLLLFFLRQIVIIFLFNQISQPNLFILLGPW